MQEAARQRLALAEELAERVEAREDLVREQGRRYWGARAAMLARIDAREPIFRVSAVRALCVN